MSITGLIDKTFRPYKGAVYRLGLAMPEPEYETATGRRLFTVAQMEKIAALAAEAEREACSDVCDELRREWARMKVGATDGRYDMMEEAATVCEDEIRERSNAKVSGEQQRSCCDSA